MNQNELNLRAGGKYLTVKLDGTAGPVVALRASGYTGPTRRLVPFECDYYWVGPTGWCVPGDVRPDLPELQITGEYREPTIAERLEAWRNKSREERTPGEFAGIVADVRKLEGGK